MKLSRKQWGEMKEGQGRIEEDEGMDNVQHMLIRKEILCNLQRKKVVYSYVVSQK